MKDKIVDLYFNRNLKQIEIANKLNLPIVIHTRDAYLDTIKM